MTNPRTITVPIPFRSGSQEISTWRVTQRLLEIERQKERVNAEFEDFKLKYEGKLK
jgi:hypothetical protein